MNYNPIVFRRSDFQGLSDRYALQNRATQLALAIEGVAPFDVTGNLFAESYRDIAQNRLARYKELWRFYEGNHFLNEFDSSGERKTVFNYCGTIVDKAASWFLGNGWEVKSKQGNELVAEAINAVYRYNGGNSLLSTLLQFGAITGDSFVFVTVNQKDDDGRMLPKEQWTVKTSALNPSFVFPFYSGKDGKVMSSCLIQFPVNDAETGKPILYSLYITNKEIRSFLNEREIGKVPNPFGKVNVVHIPNLKRADSAFGVSDIERVTSINVEYNITANRIRRIIEYHAEPTTVIMGAKLAQLEKAADTVWSGLPVDAKVQTLTLDSDLGATYQWLHELKGEICVISETPLVLLDPTDKPVSNTSGIAMEMLFQPIIEKTNRKRESYGEGLGKVNDLILIAHSLILSDDLLAYADDRNDLCLTCEFTSALPRDEAAAVDLAAKRLDSKIWSRAEAIRQCSGVSDLSRLVLEIAADDRAALALAIETARANMGQDPVMSAVFLGSPFLSEDFESIAESMGDESSAE